MSEATKYCIICGAPIKESYSFCMVCGKPTSTGGARVKAKPVTAPMPAPASEQAPVSARPATYDVASQEPLPPQAQPSQPPAYGRGLQPVVTGESRYATNDTEVYARQNGDSARPAAGGLSSVSNANYAADDEQTMVVLQDRYVLTCVETGDTFTLGLPCVIGRSRHASDVKVSSKPSVSRRHARLFLRDGQVLVEDLGATNGTFVNGIRVERGQQAPLAQGDMLRLGVDDYSFSVMRG